jgi:hypothetical protein
VARATLKEYRAMDEEEISRMLTELESSDEEGQRLVADEIS